MNKMCQTPSSMASPQSNSTSNHKTLNPKATPFVKSEKVIPHAVVVSSSLPKAEQLLPLKPFLPRSVFAPQLQLQQHPTNAPLVSMPVHSLFFYQQPTPNWAYPVAGPVYYDACEQPLGAKGLPFYVEHASQGYVTYSTSAQAAVANFHGPSYHKGFDAKIKGGRGLAVGGRGKRLQNRHFLKHRAPRFGCRKREKLVSCEERLWLPKNLESNSTSCGAVVGSKLGKKSDDDKPFSPALVSDGDHEINLEGKTSLMIKNIPYQFERHYLLHVLDQHCLEENRKAQQQSDPYKSEYDFFYLPMDFRNRANYGYAFVNFTNAAGALRFHKAFHKYEWDVSVNKKICEICCAKFQGKDALMNRFKDSVFPCRTSTYLPVVLSPPRDGVIRSRPVVVGRCITTSRNSTR